MNKEEHIIIEMDPSQIAEYAGALPPEISTIKQSIKYLLTITNNVTYIEIGVLYGGVIRQILDDFHKKITIIGVDLFEDFQLTNNNTHGGNVTTKKYLEERLLAHGYTEFKLIKGDSTKIIPQLDNMDCVCCFIDGNHSYEGCLEDFKNIYEKMNFGFILFHDSQFEEVGQVVDLAKTYPQITDIGTTQSLKILFKSQK